MNFVLVMSHIYSIPVVKVLATGDSKELNGAHLGETSIFPYTNRKDTHQPVLLNHMEYVHETSQMAKSYQDDKLGRRKTTLAT